MDPTFFGGLMIVRPRRTFLSLECRIFLGGGSAAEGCFDFIRDLMPVGLGRELSLESLMRG